MAEPLTLDCLHCGNIILLDADAQKKIRRELKLPSHAKIVECACGRYQFILGLRPALQKAAA